MNYFKNRYYAELKSTKWWAVRDKVLIRDNHKCTVCGSTKDLQVHHTFYYNSELPTHAKGDGLGFKGHHFYHCRQFTLIFYSVFPREYIF